MDSREINHQWYVRFDARSMHLVVENEDGEEVDIPAKYAVCDTCNGKGKHVNSSIDRHGLSREDFDEDPDFMEEYLNGTYDVACVECRGERVVPIVDEEHATREQIDLAARVASEHFADQAEQWNDRERGY